MKSRMDIFMHDFGGRAMRIFNLILISFCFSVLGCSGVQMQRHDWSTLQPYVLSVTPEANLVLSADTELQLEFSQSLLAESVNANTIFLISKTDFASYFDDWRDLVLDVSDRDLEVIPTSLVLSDDQKRVTLTLPNADWQDMDFVLVVTPKVLSEVKAPLKQSLNGAAQDFFAAEYKFTSLALPAEDAASSVASVATSSLATETESGEANAAIAAIASAEVSVTNDAAATASDSTTDTTATSVEADDDLVSEEEAVVSVFVVDSVIISEVVADPQQDHGDSLEGNGIAFDAMPGVGTISVTDEYVELFNGSSANVDLTGWSLSMVDGTDATQVLSETMNADLYFSLNGSLAAFAPGEFVVLGNPDGSINNALTLTLTNANGDLIESIDIADANASDIEDEAYALDFATGFWSQTLATPGYE